MGVGPLLPVVHRLARYEPAEAATKRPGVDRDTVLTRRIGDPVPPAPGDAHVARPTLAERNRDGLCIAEAHGEQIRSTILIEIGAVEDAARRTDPRLVSRRAWRVRGIRGQARHPLAGDVERSEMHFVDVRHHVRLNEQSVRAIAAELLVLEQVAVARFGPHAHRAGSQVHQHNRPPVAAVLRADGVPHMVGRHAPVAVCASVRRQDDHIFALKRRVAPATKHKLLARRFLAVQMIAPPMERGEPGHALDDRVEPPALDVQHGEFALPRSFRVEPNGDLSAGRVAVRLLAVDVVRRARVVDETIHLSARVGVGSDAIHGR